MARLAAAGGIGGGEGIDAGLPRPTGAIGEGEVIAGPGWTLTALATPGHTADHLSFAWAEADALFSGDLVMGWATPVISPPDGDLGGVPREPRAAARRAARRVYYPGHGAPVADPRRLIALGARPPRGARGRDRRGAGARAGDGGRRWWRRSTPGSTRRCMPAAARNVLAHLIDLAERGLAGPDGPPAAGRPGGSRASAGRAGAAS